MMDDARAAGLSPVICSSYRTQEKQQSLFDRQVSSYMAKGYSKEAAKEIYEKGLCLEEYLTQDNPIDEKQKNHQKQPCLWWFFGIDFPVLPLVIFHLLYIQMSSPLSPA